MNYGQPKPPYVFCIKQNTCEGKKRSVFPFQPPVEDPFGQLRLSSTNQHPTKEDVISSTVTKT